MQAKKQTDSFVEALLNHCAGLEVMVLRSPGTPDEAPSSTHRVHCLADLERLRGWLWHENASRLGQVFCRPSQGEPHPWLFLDDVAKPAAEKLAGRWACLVVETSPGNCQLRILADQPLGEDERTKFQRALAMFAQADLGSIAGSKWGRLPGFRNRKPGRDCWTNLVVDTTATARPFPADRPAATAFPSPAAPAANEGGRGLGLPPVQRIDGTDVGGFRAEFAFACHRLRDGLDCGEVTRLVADHAFRRGKRHTWPSAVKYAERTVAAALRSLR